MAGNRKKPIGGKENISIDTNFVSEKKLGIIGGMGSWASAYIFEKIVERTNAGTDQGHIHILLDNHTSVPDRTAAILKGGPSLVNEIKKSIDLMDCWGAEVIIIPCNTSHFYFDELNAYARGRLLNILDISAAKAEEQFHRSKCGILATSGTISLGVYQSKLLERGIPYVIPEDNEQDNIMEYIYDYVKTGKEVLRGFYDLVFPVVESLKMKGVEYFLLGCTELSTLASIPDFCHAFNYVDSSLELALAAISQCGYEIKNSL